MSEKKKERCFFVAIAILFLDIFNDVGNAVASVDELTRYRFEFALVEKIAVNVADVGNTGFYTCTVAVAETALYMVLFVERGVNCGIFGKLSA